MNTSRTSMVWTSQTAMISTGTAGITSGSGLWLAQGLVENTNIFELINSTKSSWIIFCYSEETIFKSCGIPIRFKIAFQLSIQETMILYSWVRENTRKRMSGAQRFLQRRDQDFILVREKMFEIFDGGDRLRIFRLQNSAHRTSCMSSI